MTMEPIDKLINFLKGNHTWTRLYKPGEITEPISKAIEKSGENMGKTMADAMESNKAVAKIQLGQGVELSLPITTQIKGEKGEKGEKGNPGKDSDEEKIIREVLKKIVLPKDGKDADEDRIVRSILGKLKRPKDGKDAVVDYGYIVDETLKAIADEYPGWKPMTEFEIREMIREAVPKVNGFTKADRRGIIDELKKEVQKLSSNAKNVSYSLWQRAIGVKNLDDVDLTAPTNGQALTYSNGKWVNSTVSGGSGSPGGSDTQVQFNDGGAFGGDAGLVYNKTTNVLTVGDVIDSGLTASTILSSDGSKQITSLSTATYPSLTELAYLKGVTSAVQTQISAKLSNIVEDTTPQLGGDLDLNGHVVTGLVIGTNIQAYDSDLTTIAGLTATTNNIIQSVSSAWASRTPTQVTATLDSMVGDSGSGGTKGLVPAPASGDASKFLRGDATWVTISGGGDALTTNPLSQFASTTSLQLAGVISDETGSGALVFATSPTLVTPVLGTPSSGTLTSCTGLPISTGVSGLGTGVATALAVNTGSAGAVVLYNGALGTPSSGTVTNLTGTASININGTVGATTPASGAFTTLSASTSVTMATSDASATPTLAVTQGSTGDAAMKFALSTTRSYAIGIDNSVSDSFVISTAASSSAVLGTTNLFSLTTAGALTLTSSLTATAVLVSSNDGGALGASGTAFSDLFLASGGVINFNAGNATITHSAGLLTSNVPLSLGTSNAFTCGTIELGAASDTTIARSGAGDITVEGNAIYRAGGTDVPVADGGTGASNAAGAKTNLGFITDLVDDTTPQLGGALDANGKNITDVQELRLDATPDANSTATGKTTNSINAAGSITAFTVVYLDGSGTWSNADASSTTTTDKMLAVALESGSVSTPMLVALPGSFVRNDSWNWTVGGAVYLSETTGALTQTAPTTTDAVVRVLGYAITANILWFNTETGVVHV